MQEFKKDVELIGGNVIDTSDGVFIRAFNKNEVKKIQDLIKKYPEYKLGCFVKCNIYNCFYYETVIER
jgi:hypothetical protein